MEELKIPTPGRVVHYFPNGADAVSAKNNAPFVPAMVVQSFGNSHLNLSVFTMNPDAINVLRYSVNHVSQVPTEGQAYWEWPKI